MAQPINPAAPPASSRTAICFQLPPTASSPAAKPTHQGMAGSFKPIAIPVIRPARADSKAALRKGPLRRASRLQTMMASPASAKPAMTLS